MMIYCVGFVSDGYYILLIKKNRPTWQKGKLNGIGGKVEEGETTLEAMVRECREETGLCTVEKDWLHKLNIKKREWSIDFFTYNGGLIPSDSTSLTDEELEIIPLLKLTSYPLIPNLQWIIPLVYADYMKFPIYMEEK